MGRVVDTPAGPGYAYEAPTADVVGLAVAAVPVDPPPI